MNEKSEDLYRVLEEASRQVKDWPAWKRSEDAKRELEKLAQERQQKETAGGRAK